MYNVQVLVIKKAVTIFTAHCGCGTDLNPTLNTNLIAPRSPFDSAIAV